VQGLRDRLIEMRGDVRAQFVQSLRSHPAYADLPEGSSVPHSPYRVLIDSIVEAANMELHETDKGLAGGTRARADASARRDFAIMHNGLRSLALKHNSSWKTPEAARAFLERRPDLAVRVLRIMESKGLQAGIRRYTEDGELTAVTFPQWIYDVLAEKETARAEMMLLRNTLIYGKAALSQNGDDGKLD